MFQNSQSVLQSVNWVQPVVTLFPRTSFCSLSIGRNSLGFEEGADVEYRVVPTDMPAIRVLDSTCSLSCILGPALALPLLLSALPASYLTLHFCPPYPSQSCCIVPPAPCLCFESCPPRRPYGPVKEVHNRRKCPSCPRKSNEPDGGPEAGPLTGKGVVHFVQAFLQKGLCPRTKVPVPP